MSSPTRAVTEFVGLYAVTSTSFTCQGDSHAVPVTVSPFCQLAEQNNSEDVSLSGYGTRMFIAVCDPFCALQAYMDGSR